MEPPHSLTGEGASLFQDDNNGRIGSMAKAASARRVQAPPVQTMDDLLEEALQLEVDVTDEDGNELGEAELRERVEATKAEQGAPQGAEVAEPEAEPAQPPVPATTGRKGGPRPRGLAVAKTDLRLRIRSPDPELLERCKLPAPSDADYRLADLHGYPVAIPGAKAYRISISIVCAFGCGERLAGSVMLLIDSVAANKLEYLTAV